MAEVLVFHHVQGLTDGVKDFAQQLRDAGHTVHLPDLFDGHTFGSVDEGFAYVKEAGLDAIEAGTVIAEALPAELVYLGFSYGVMPAQKLAQTRPGARGALLVYSAIGAEHFGGWPDGLSAQVHAMDADSFFVDDGDIDAARALVAAHPEVELFLYPGDQHLFADSSLPAYDAEAAALMTGGVLEFLAAR